MQQYTVIGRGLEHSLAPVVYRALFYRAGLPADYTASPLEEEQLADPASVQWLRELDGFQVAWPFQRKIVPYLDRLEPSAEGCRSVTAVRRDPDGALVGANTSIPGLLGALGDRGLQLQGKVCVVGCGAVGRNFLAEALSRGCQATLAVLPHQWLQAGEMLLPLKEAYPDNPPRLLLTDQLEEPFDLMINTTLSGMYPRIDELPVPLEALVHTRAVFDLIHNPSTTLLIREAARCGCAVAGGAGMLVHQAASTIRFWGGPDFAQEDLARLTALVENLTTPSVAMDLEGTGTIALCGFMGAGKETVGRLVAKRTGRRFLDLEQLITGKTGRTEAQLLQEMGYQKYARLENRLVEELCGLPGLVLAVTSQAAVRPENLPHLRRCRTVFLDTPFHYCLARMDHSHPLAAERDEVQLYQLYQNWYPLWYWISHNRVDGRGTPQEVAERICTTLRTNQSAC